MELDSDSDYFFSGIMNNCPNNNFLPNNEFLRENFSRPTNDVSDIQPFQEESPSLGPFNYIPFKNKLSDLNDNSELCFNDNKDENNNGNENTNDIRQNNDIDKINTVDNKPEPIALPKPEQNSTSRNTSAKFITQRDNTKEITSGLTFLSYISLIFTLFSAKKPKGRTPNFLKNNQNYINKSQHTKDNLDNLKLKVIRKCFKEIGEVIYFLCLSFGLQYKPTKLVKTDKIKSNEEILNLCEKKMADIFYHSNPKNIKENSPNFNKNRRIYDRLVLEDKINQSTLLARIFDMTFGEILYKFINDDNFTKKIDQNYNFKSFSEIFGKKYSEELVENAQQNLRKLLGNLEA